MTGFTHFNAQGEVHMVDVGEKPNTHRKAVAEGYILMQEDTLTRITQGTQKKGDVLGTARIAGIMGAKKTADLIPLCHPVAINAVNVELEVQPEHHRIRCIAEVSTDGKTGVEMEALIAVQICLLTVYDMCKSVDRGMIISDIKLLKKSGGRSGPWERGSI